MRDFILWPLFGMLVMLNLIQRLDVVPLLVILFPIPVLHIPTAMSNH